MELVPINKHIIKSPQEENSVANDLSFIKANSKPITLSELNRDCIVPVFAKDNEVSISHSQFIEVGLEALKKTLNKPFTAPRIRVSHQIKGRTPDAIYLPANELKLSQKTIYYERMAWVVRVPEISIKIGGNEVALAIGGVRAYNQENLHSKKSPEKFKFFVGFQNMVCLNLCISTDGLKTDLKTDNLEELLRKLQDSILCFNYQEETRQLKELENHSLSEKQFATMLGKLRLYNHLPLDEKKELPEILLTDNQFNMMAKDYYSSESFCRDESGNINLWRLYNLMTSANKSSYIDSHLERNVNGFELVKGIAKSLDGDLTYKWFLN